MQSFPASRLLFKRLKFAGSCLIGYQLETEGITRTLNCLGLPLVGQNNFRNYYNWREWDNRRPAAVTNPEVGAEVIVVGSGQIWDDRSGGE